MAICWHNQLRHGKATWANAGQPHREGRWEGQAGLRYWNGTAFLNAILGRVSIQCGRKILHADRAESDWPINSFPTPRPPFQRA